MLMKKEHLNLSKNNRCVAHVGRALVSKTKGRGFDSFHVCKLKKRKMRKYIFIELDENDADYKSSIHEISDSTVERITDSILALRERPESKEK